MRTVFLIHGYNGIPEIFKWLKEELEERKYQVIMPAFPSGEEIGFRKWIEILDLYKDKFNTDTIVIAHSIGNSFILRYLEINDINIKLFIGLAGFCEKFKTDGRKYLNNAIEEFCNTNEILKAKEKIEKIYSIYSNTDHIVPIDILESFAKKLSAESILLEKVGHMGSKSGIKHLPEVLEIIEREDNIK